jgi:hypothetical protein
LLSSMGEGKMGVRGVRGVGWFKARYILSLWKGGGRECRD